MRADARRNRERVLAAARDAFAADGADVPLDDIARRAGVGPGTVYRHFATKEALLAAVVVERYEDLVVRARELAAGDRDPVDAFVAFLELALAEYAVKRDLRDGLPGAGAALAETRGSEPVWRELREVLGELLGAAQATGGVRTDVDVEAVLALVSGTSVAIGRAGDAAAGVLTRVLVDGLRAR